MKYKIKFDNVKNEYTLNENAKTIGPPKFSIDDKYSKYRLIIKRKEWNL